MTRTAAKGIIRDSIERGMDKDLGRRGRERPSKDPCGNRPGGPSLKINLKKSVDLLPPTKMAG